MRKIIVVLIALTLFLPSSFFAQSEADQAYIKAMTSQDPGQKAQLLKEYIRK